MEKKVIIYTAIYSDKDNLMDPINVSDNCKYICFTDNPSLKSKVWDVRLETPEMGDNNLNAKYYKVLPHRCFKDETIENSVWVDGAREIIGDINIFIDKVAENFTFNSIKLLKHPEGRNCLYEEVDKLLYLNSIGNHKVSNDIITKQRDKYLDEGMPKHFGLFNCPILIRKHFDSYTQKMGELWWEEINKESKRDQVSLPFILWKNNIPFNVIPLETFNGDDNNIFKWYPHKR